MAVERNIGIPAETNIRPTFKTSTHAVTFSNENRGGTHVYASVKDACLRLTRDRMETAMGVVLVEQPLEAIPTREYRMRKLPYADKTTGKFLLFRPANFKESDYNIIEITAANFLDFFELRFTAKEMSGEYQEQFAPDYSGTFYDDKPAWMTREEPPFPYSEDAAWHDANWSSTLDTAAHKWKRHRYGDNNWSKPYAIYGNAQPKDYIDIRQLFVLREPSSGTPIEPETPSFTLADGTLNNEPVDATHGPWEDGAELPAGANVADYTFWEIQGPKNVYGQLKLPWQKKMVEINGDLIRYAESSSPDANTLAGPTESAAPGTAADTRLNEKKIVAIPKGSIHKYRWSRQKKQDGTYTVWKLNKFVEESGEYAEFMYRAFPENLLSYIIGNPDAIWTAAMGGDDLPFRPTEKQPERYSDRPFNPPAGHFLAKIHTVKYFNGELKRPWSDPVPDGTKNVPIHGITSDAGNDFKKDKNDVYLPASINLEAYLYMGDRLLNGVENITYKWTRIYNGGGDVTIDEADNFGTSRTAAVSPAQVNGKAIFECKQTWNKPDGSTEVFASEYEILDIHDGLNARLLTLQWNSNVFMVNGAVTSPSEIRLRAIEQNIFDADSALTWKRVTSATYHTAGFDWGTVAALTYTGKKLVVAPTDFDGTSNEYVYYCEAVDSKGNKFFDEVEITRIAVESGSDSFAVSLSNSTDQIATNADGSLIDTTFANDKTTFRVFEGGTEVTGQFTASATVENIVSDGLGTDNTVTVSVDAVNRKVSVTGWGKNVSAATATLKFFRAGDGTTANPDVTITKDWKLVRQKGFAELVLVDIDSVKAESPGFTFKPGDTAAKTLKANIMRNSAPIADAEYANYSIAWYDEYANHDVYTLPSSDVVPIGTARTQDFAPERVEFKNTVLVVVTTPEGMKISRRVDLTDVKDAKKQWILFGGYRTAPKKESDITAMPAVLGEVSPQKIDYSVNLTNGYKLGTRSAVALQGDGKHWNRAGELYDSAGALQTSTLWITDNLASLPLAWQDNGYFVIYGKEVDKSTVIWDKWIRVGAEKAAAGQNGGFFRDYFCIQSLNTILRDETQSPNDLPFGSASPLNTDGSLKATVTSNNITWYRQLPKFDEATQRIWKVQAEIGWTPNNIKEFRGWSTLLPFTAKPGPKGNPGSPGIRWRGNYDETGSYVVNDVVKHNGSAWICTQPNDINNTNTPYGSSTHWQLLVEAGDLPAHQWSGTSIRFQNPDGTWGPYVNLKGDAGPSGNNDIKLYRTDHWTGNAQQGGKMVVDTGDTTTKTLKITFSIRTYGDYMFSMGTGTMTSSGSTTVYNQQNNKYKRDQLGAHYTSYSVTRIITTSHRYIWALGSCDHPYGKVYEEVLEVVRI